MRAHAANCLVCKIPVQVQTWIYNCSFFLSLQDGCPEPYASSASESDSTAHSPQHHPFMQQGNRQAPPLPPTSLSSTRPPPLTRVSSEATASIHTQLAEATISSGQVSPIMTLPPPPPTSSAYQRQVNITSPLAMHAVHHSSNQNLLHSSLEHHSPPPVWQRPSPIPNGFALYGQ